MDRRALLAGAASTVGAALAGCITIGGEPNQHLRWSTALDGTTGTYDWRALAATTDTIAAITDHKLFGVGVDGSVGWERFENASGVFGLEDGSSRCTSRTTTLGTTATTSS